jgi:hypothetical protein
MVEGVDRVYGDIKRVVLLIKESSTTHPSVKPNFHIYKINY